MKRRTFPTKLLARVMPFRIEDEAKKLGAEFKRQSAFEPFAIKDGNLITGQQQHSELRLLNLLLILLVNESCKKAVRTRGICNINEPQ